MKNKNTIFLDIDGVLTNDKVLPGKASIAAILTLSHIMHEVPADIVIISDRRKETLEKTIQDLIDFGIDRAGVISDRIVGQTRRFMPSRDYTGEREIQITRGLEIMDYCEEHDISNYVILDDITSYYMEEQLKRCAIISRSGIGYGEKGLEDIKFQCKRILNTEKKKKEKD